MRSFVWKCLILYWIRASLVLLTVALLAVGLLATSGQSRTQILSFWVTSVWLKSPTCCLGGLSKTKKNCMIATTSLVASPLIENRFLSHGHHICDEGGQGEMGIIKTTSNRRPPREENNKRISRSMEALHYIYPWIIHM